MNQQDLAIAVANALKQQLPDILSQLIPNNNNNNKVKQENFSTPKLQIQNAAHLQRSSSGLSSSSSSLSRSSSGLSSSSFSSSPSPSIQQVDDDEVVFVGKRNSPHLPADKNVVRWPVMNKIDAKFLAPPNSTLFKRFFKKKRNRDGTRSLKKKREMDEVFFQDLIRPVIRQLLGTAGLNSANLSARYFHAAAVLARKRRNNHMNSWRENGNCCPLIYGGELPPGCHNPYPPPGQNSSRKKRSRKLEMSAEVQEVKPRVGLPLSKYSHRRNKRCVTNLVMHPSPLRFPSRAGVPFPKTSTNTKTPCI